MWILGAGLLARGLAGQSAELLITTGRQREILFAGLTAVLFNVGLSVLLIPHYGIEGAAAATAVAMAVRSVMQCLAVRRSLNLSVIALGLPSLRLSAAG
jgi:O-antigen/teichoic acid export membrane protein